MLLSLLIIRATTTLKAKAKIHITDGKIKKAIDSFKLNNAYANTIALITKDSVGDILININNNAHA